MHDKDHFDHIGMVARWRPVHLGHEPILRALCDRAVKATIGIGSSNRYRTTYTLVPGPDLDDGPRWRKMVVELFGSLDLFVTANPYVSRLLAGDYRIVRPVALVPPEQKIAIDGTMVRREMARGNDWRPLVPAEVADYIAARRLDDRFRREFGLPTLALDALVTRRPGENKN
jgi:nicotinamide-nucleotide adenylyltransferase